LPAGKDELIISDDVKYIINVTVVIRTMRAKCHAEFPLDIFINNDGVCV